MRIVTCIISVFGVFIYNPTKFPESEIDALVCTDKRKGLNDSNSHTALKY
jgi:hypothetical protein